MSLFDDVQDEIDSPSEFGPQEGFAGVLICASACDGHIGDEEGQNLNLILGSRKLYQRLSSQQFSAMIDRLIGVVVVNHGAVDAMCCSIRFVDSGWGSFWRLGSRRLRSSQSSGHDHK